MRTSSDARKAAFAALGINQDNKVIICLDGGGIRGILTIQLLKKLEEIAGIPCYELADMVAGSSTGAIIAGLIANGNTAVQVEDLYNNLVAKVFKKRLLGNRYVNPPAYDKVNYRLLLNKVVGDVTLSDAVALHKTDLLITAKDGVAGEMTFFSCFEKDGTTFGTYKDILLRSAMEATMSAPTYFRPFERFLDGGTTTFNNPSLAAIMEAVNYNPGADPYELNKLTVFSFGTGTKVRFNTVAQLADPPGADLAFWVSYVMDEAGQDASSMQSDIIRKGISKLGLDYRRFQISFDEDAIVQLPDRKLNQIAHVNANWLRGLTNDELDQIEMDSVEGFPLVKEIGLAFADYIVQSGNLFKTDLVNTNGRDALITSRGTRDITRVQTQMKDPNWVGIQPTA